MLQEQKLTKVQINRIAKCWQEHRVKNVLPVNDLTEDCKYGPDRRQYDPNTFLSHIWSNKIEFHMAITQSTI